MSVRICNCMSDKHTNFCGNDVICDFYGQYCSACALIGLCPYDIGTSCECNENKTKCKCLHRAMCKNIVKDGNSKCEFCIENSCT